MEQFPNGKKSNQMFKIPQRPLINKKDPQKFIQYGIREKKFNTIMVNDPSSICMKPAIFPLPPAFKPLSSSTPKRKQKSSPEIIDNFLPAAPVTVSAPRLNMAQFIGENPNKVTHVPTTDLQKPNISNEKTTMHLEEPPHPQPSTSASLWKKQCANILDTKLQKELSFSKSAKRRRRYYDENFQILENYIHIKASSNPAETIHDLTILNKIVSKYTTSTTKGDLNLPAKDVGLFKVPEIPPLSKTMTTGFPDFYLNRNLEQMPVRPTYDLFVSQLKQEWETLCEFKTTTTAGAKQKKKVPKTAVKSIVQITDNIFDLKSGFPNKNELDKQNIGNEIFFNKNNQLMSSSKRDLALRLKSKREKSKNSFSKDNKLAEMSDHFVFDETLTQTYAFDSIERSGIENRLRKLLNITNDESAAVEDEYKNISVENIVFFGNFDFVSTQKKIFKFDGNM